MTEFKELYKRHLDTVGIDTFIKYFDYFRYGTNTQKLFEAFELSKENWNKNSYSVKASSGKRIFKLGLEVESLRYIAFEANPNRIGFETQQKAMLLLKEFEDVNTQKEIEEIDKSENFSDLSISEKKILRKYRVGQSSFRRKLFNYWEGCSVSGCKNYSVLIASHIKQYCLCSPPEKYDLFNGLLLSPNYDKLFDEYLITFNDNGDILISDTLSSSDLEKLGVSPSDCLNKNKLRQEHLIYLREHRRMFEENN